MPVEESWPDSSATDQKGSHPPNIDPKSGFDPTSGIFHSLHQLTDHFKFPTSPNLDTASYVLSQLASLDEAESRTALVDSVTGHRVTFAELRRSIESLAVSLHLALEVKKGDVVFVLAPNSIMYPTICLAVFLIGAILTTANPLNTGQEIAKQVRDSGAKLVITVPEEAHKVASTGVPTIFTNQTGDESLVSVEELIECSYSAGNSPRNWPRPARTDTAAILYSSGTTGTSKGVVLTHDNFISIITLLKWSVNASSSQDDVFLCFIPMFHIYGLAFFGLGLFCSGVTTVMMPKYELGAMLDAIKAYQVNNIPAVPPVILGLVKHTYRLNSDLSSLRRIGSGAAPLSKEVTDGFREKFPWVELRQGYGLTESCGAATFFVSDRLAKARSGSCGALIPSFQAKVVNVETGSALPPNRKGELWLRSPTIMTGYLRNEEATAATITSDGWLRTGDLCYIDGDGFVYIVDRIKELIKHNGYQVAPAELEAVLLSHPDILDAAVIPVEDEDAGQIPMAYVVRATGSNLTEEQVIRFVASQVAPYKKVRRVRFVTTIPKSAAGKILRKELVLQSRQHLGSKL